MSRNRIVKGIAVAGYVKPEKGMHDGLMFLYLPMTPSELSALNDELDRVTKVGNKAICDLLTIEVAKRITWWDECDENKTIIAVSAADFGLFPDLLWSRIVKIVRSQEPSDFPDVGSDQEKALVLLAQRAAAKGELPGLAVITDIIKNLSAASN